MVGDLGVGVARETMAVVGEGPNIAARLHQAAAPDTVVVSADTCRAVRGYFECRSLGLQQLRGLPRPVEAFEILASTGATTRLEASPALTPMVNRRQEIALLRRAWSRAGRGQGRAILLRGEAGWASHACCRSCAAASPMKAASPCNACPSTRPAPCSRRWRRCCGCSTCPGRRAPR
ncbi:hypothetical protein ACFQU2_25625 [Siccirubricoccus deserti]